MPLAFASLSTPPSAYAAIVSGEAMISDLAPRLSSACAAPMFEYRGPMFDSA
jgi:hypothetical protein